MNVGHRAQTPKKKRYPHREKILDGARDAVMRDRNAEYGEPHQDFKRSAEMMTVFLRGAGKLADGETIEPHEVAIVQVMVKLSRLAHSPDHFDSVLDIAGYMACYWEALQIERLEQGSDD